MKKENLLTIILLVMFTGIISTVFYSCKPQKNIGLQLYSIRDSIKKDVPGTIEKVGKMGYKFVEPAGYKDGKFYGMEPAAFKALCETNGMSVLSSHTGRPFRIQQIMIRQWHGGMHVLMLTLLPVQNILFSLQWAVQLMRALKD